MILILSKHAISFLSTTDISVKTVAKVRPVPLFSHIDCKQYMQSITYICSSMYKYRFAACLAHETIEINVWQMHFP